MKKFTIFCLNAAAVLLSVNVYAEIRVGNIVVGDEGIQVGNDISVNPGGVQVPGVSVGPGQDPEFEHDDDREDNHAPGYGAGAGAGAGAGSGAGKHSSSRSNTIINRNQGSIVIDGKPVRNQTIINRSNN